MNARVHTPVRSGLVAGIAALLLAGCADVPTRSDGPLTPDGPQLLINGSDGFDRTAVGAIMVYDPDFAAKPGWRSFCSGTLIHTRVLMTAGHCVQGIERQLNSGVFHAAWISFQQDPLAHFNTPPAEGDPAIADTLLRSRSVARRLLDSVTGARRPLPLPEVPHEVCPT